ncbi:hypothetical protein FH972_010902 [Carpinus fangiana]|uniref:Uncharacterized protein n=1 Tax=Carpinus fangiana TaxID=176857 RepID=A0A660KPL7_9ROSI|nr:hypothetical protein FH972_010902 [Carpinus fangiana]
MKENNEDLAARVWIKTMKLWQALDGHLVAVELAAISIANTYYSIGKESDIFDSIYVSVCAWILWLFIDASIKRSGTNIKAVRICRSRCLRYLIWDNDDLDLPGERWSGTDGQEEDATWRLSHGRLTRMSNVEKLRTEHESTHEKLAQSQTHSKNSLIKKQKGKDNGEESGKGGEKARKCREEKQIRVESQDSEEELMAFNS